MRFETPVVAGGRYATADFEIGGEQIKAGDQLTVCWAAANLDGDGFDDALRSTSTARRQAPHRVRAAASTVAWVRTWRGWSSPVILGALHERIPDYALDPRPRAVGYNNTMIRTVDPLPLVFTPPGVSRMACSGQAVTHKPHVWQSSGAIDDRLPIAAVPAGSADPGTEIAEVRLLRGEDTNLEDVVRRQTCTQLPGLAPVAVDHGNLSGRRRLARTRHGFRSGSSQLLVVELIPSRNGSSTAREASTSRLQRSWPASAMISICTDGERRGATARRAPRPPARSCGRRGSPAPGTAARRAGPTMAPLGSRRPPAVLRAPTCGRR